MLGRTRARKHCAHLRVAGATTLAWSRVGVRRGGAPTRRAEVFDACSCNRGVRQRPLGLRSRCGERRFIAVGGQRLSARACPSISSVWAGITKNGWAAGSVHDSNIGSKAPNKRAVLSRADSMDTLAAGARKLAHGLAALPFPVANGSRSIVPVSSKMRCTARGPGMMVSSQLSC